jgi:hypothetical protein
MSGTDTAALRWKYLNSMRTPPSVGVTSATITFCMPITPGTYDFRFFRDGTHEKLATSVTVTVP